MIQPNRPENGNHILITETGGPPRSRDRRFYALLRTIVLLAIAVVLLVPPGRTFADEPGEVALVIQFDDGRQETRCIPIDDDFTAGNAFTGADLLDRSGMRIIIDASSGMGITVCQVEELGCAYPAVDCFCQCMTGSECRYWNYYYRDPVEGGGSTDWVYSPFGAKLRVLLPGTLEAWVWGDGTSPPSDELTFESVCGSLEEPPTDEPQATQKAAAPTPTYPPATATATAPKVLTEGEAASPEPLEPPATGQPTPEETAVPSPTAVTGDTDTGSVAPEASEESSGSGLGTYWPFFVMIIGLVVAGRIIRHRQMQRPK
jgi:hypothetical protein